MSTPEQRSELAAALDGNVVLVGIGNPLRGDDGLGPELGRRLAGVTGHECIDAGTTPENQIGPILRRVPDGVLLVDAVDLEERPGAWALLMPEQFHGTGHSTHNPGLRLLLDCLRAERVERVRLLGVQPARIGLGTSMSRPVKRALRRIVRMARRTRRRVCSPAERR